MRSQNKLLRRAITVLLVFMLAMIPLTLTASEEETGVKGSAETDLIVRRDLTELFEGIEDEEGILNSDQIKLPEFSDELECADELNAEVDELIEAIEESLALDIEYGWQGTGAFYQIAITDDLISCHVACQTSLPDQNYIDLIMLIDPETGERLHDRDLLDLYDVDEDALLSIYEKNLLRDFTENDFSMADEDYIATSMLYFWDTFDTDHDTLFLDRGERLKAVIHRRFGSDYGFDDIIDFKLYRMPAEEPLNPLFVRIAKALDIDVDSADILIANVGQANDEPSVEALIKRLPVPEDRAEMNWDNMPYTFMQQIIWPEGDEMPHYIGEDFLLVIPKYAAMLVGAVPDETLVDYRPKTLLPVNALLNFNLEEGGVLQAAYRGDAQTFEVKAGKKGLEITNDETDFTVFDFTDDLDKIPERGFNHPELFDEIMFYFPKG